MLEMSKNSNFRMLTLPKNEIFGSYTWQMHSLLKIKIIFQKQATPFFSYNHSSQRIKFRKLAFFFNFHKARAREKCLLINQSYLHNHYRLIIMRSFQKFSISAKTWHDIQQLSINLPGFTQFVQHQLMNWQGNSCKFV